MATKRSASAVGGGIGVEMQPKVKINCLMMVLLLAAEANGTAYAGPHDLYRSCVIQEHFDNGGYTYLRCREAEKDIWLATMQASVNRGDTVSYPDSPPLTNFSSKSLNRTFDKIIFVPGLFRGRGAAAAPVAVTEAPVQDSGDPASLANGRGDTIYAGMDDHGTFVFTDDPSKLRKPAKVKRRGK